MDTFTCVAELLPCASETITTLLIAILQHKIKSLKNYKGKKSSIWEAELKDSENLVEPALEFSRK